MDFDPPLEAELKTYQLLENKTAYQWSSYGILLRDQGLSASAAYYAARHIASKVSISLNYYQQKRQRLTVSQAA